MSPRDLFLQHLPHIEKAARYAARRSRLRPEDAEEFLSTVHLKLIEDDYRVIRLHKGKGSLATYLVMVIQNSMRDFKNHLWGKWRASADAKGLGALAVRLEELIARDHLTLDEAYEILKTNEKAPVSRNDVEELMARLPPRVTKRFERDDQLLDLAAGCPTPEESLIRREDRALRDQAVSTLRQALTGLEAEDQVILKMCGDFKIREIAKLLGKEERALYRRIDKIKKGLRQALENRGVRREHVTAPERE
jgi:RNA polymerase sigma factor (sigma-70 family)